MTLNLEHTTAVSTATKANQHGSNPPRMNDGMQGAAKAAGLEGRIDEGRSTEGFNQGTNAYKPRTPWGRLYELNGERLTLRQWADRTGVKVNTLKLRLRRGYTTERALTEGTTDRRECLRRATMAKLAKRGDDRMERD